MPRKPQEADNLTPQEKKLVEFGDIIQDVAIFDPDQYHAILRSVEFRPKEKPMDYVERMQMFAGPPLMKLAVINVKKNPNLSAKIFMFYMEPLIKRQSIDLTVHQQRPEDFMSDLQVIEGLIDELLKNPEARKILRDKLRGMLLEDKGESNKDDSEDGGDDE
jgi:hypothetical protein